MWYENCCCLLSLCLLNHFLIDLNALLFPSKWLSGMNSLQRLPRKLKLVTFDVTGTLLTFKRPVGEQYAEAGSKFNVNLESDLLTHSFSKHWKQMNKDHPNYGFNSGLGWESWWHQIVHQTFIDAAPSMKLDKEKLANISHYLTEIYKESDCWELCDGAMDILEGLRQNHTAIGVISNFDPRLEQILINMKIRGYFKFIIASYSVGIEKPDSRIFHLAVQLNEDKSLQGCDILHVGNSHTLDIQAALKAGWNACLIELNEDAEDGKHLHDHLFKHSDHLSLLTVKDLHQLKTFLLSS